MYATVLKQTFMWSYMHVHRQHIGILKETNFLTDVPWHSKKKENPQNIAHKIISLLSLSVMFIEQISQFIYFGVGKSSNSPILLTHIYPSLPGFWR